MIVDFDLRKDSGEFVKQRARAAKEVYFQEIQAAGFQLIAAQGEPALQDNFFAQFRRLEGRADSQTTPMADGTIHEGR